MDSKTILYFFAILVLSVSTVSALNCISCSQYLNSTIGGPTSDNNEPCQTRKNGTTTPCEDGLVCATIYNPNTTLLTRGCEKLDICEQHKSSNCSTCSTDLCGSSGFTINPLFAPVLAGLIFATLGR